MSKTKAIIIIVLVLLLGTVVFYFLAGGKTPVGIPILDYLPFGKAPESPTGGFNNGTSRDNSGAGDGATTGGQTNPNPQSVNSLFKLSDSPVAGFGAYSASGTPRIRYVDRATGHVTDVNVTTLEKTKIYNNTSPKIYVALFRPGASGFVKRELVQDSDTVLNTAVILTPPKATTTSASSEDASLYTAVTSVINGNIGDILPLPNGALVYNTLDTGDIVLSQFAGEKPKRIFNSTFSEWRLATFGSEAIIVYTKPSASVPGYLYSLNLKTGSLQKIIGPATALSAIGDPDGKHILYNYIDSSGKFALSVLNLSNDSPTSIKPVTLAEKCLWSKKIPSIVYCGIPQNGFGSNAPDEWYLGITHYNDRVWRLNTITGTAEILIDPKELGIDSIDLINPELSEDEDYLYFINKNDLSLWAFKL